MSRSISSMVRCWIGVDGRCADVASASLLSKARLHDGARAEKARGFGAVERPRRQHGIAVALGDELEDRRHRVDLHRHLRSQAERREPRLDEHPDRVRPAGNDQRMERQVGEAERAGESTLAPGADEAQLLVEERARIDRRRRDGL